jgi:outer membrane protein assembly factor BamB
MSPFRTGVGEPTRTFRYWAGDDTDATLVGDVDGTMYVATEVDRGTARGAEVGQVLKLDPSQPEPLVWSWSDPDGRGVWATPALHNGVLFVPTDGGLVVSLDAATGAQLWQLRLPGPLWQSPVIVDDVLVMGDCRGVLHGFDVTDPRVQPPELWNVALSGCIESTPAVWNGRIYVGTRSGRFYAVA